MPDTTKDAQDRYGNNEAEARFRRLLRSAVNTPPAQLKSLAPIGVPAQQKRGKKPTAPSLDASSASARNAKRGAEKPD